MAPTRPPERILHAADLLDLRPGDRVLEIGPGRGASIEHLASLIGHGHLTAVDRSATAVEDLRRRHAEPIADGAVTVIEAPLGELRLPAASVDKALAVNVNLFWTGTAATELAVLQAVLAEGGRLCLAYQPPDGRTLDRIAAAVADNLRNAGFTPTEHRPGPTLTALLATPSPTARRTA